MKRNLLKLKRYIPIVAVLLLLVITLTTCLSRQKKTEPVVESPSPIIVVPPPESPSPSAPASPDPTSPEESEETPEPPYTGPFSALTGLPVEADNSMTRPIAVMINNVRNAQPVLGVTDADIIYEAPVEGGITRMLAIYSDVSGVEKIGSVRSARLYYVDIIDAYDAVYIHAGGSPGAYTALKNRNITRLDGVNGPKTDIFVRDSARRSSLGYEHSLITTGALISQYLPTYGFRLEHNDDFNLGLDFTDDDAISNGENATEFDIYFSSSKKTAFSYSKDENVYRVSQFGSQVKDGNDGTVLSVSNVLVLRTQISTIAGDTEGRLDVKLTGSGTGYFVSGGKYEKIKWSRSGAQGQFKYTSENGTPLKLGRGKTYICIIPEATGVDIK